MHEMSVAQNILEIAGEAIAHQETAKVRSIRLRIGQMSGIVCDSLEFCFSVISEGTPFQDAVLDIEQPATRARCNECGRTSPLEYGMFICPACGSSNIAVLSGTELQVVSLELDNEPTESPS